MLTWVPTLLCVSLIEHYNFKLDCKGRFLVPAYVNENAFHTSQESENQNYLCMVCGSMVLGINTQKEFLKTVLFEEIITCILLQLVPVKNVYVVEFYLLYYNWKCMVIPNIISSHWKSTRSTVHTTLYFFSVD